MAADAGQPDPTRDLKEEPMSGIAIITDSDSSLPLELTAARGIRQVPITVHFGDTVLKSGEEISDEQVFERVDREGVLPTTAAPAPGAFLAAYEDAFAAGAESIICFCVSSEISATYSAAVAARELLEDREVHVVDTRTLSIPQGFMALAAQEAAERGMPAEAIIAHAESLRDRTVLYAALATLRYLAMSGRVGHLAAGMGNLLNVKPILTIRNGKLDLLEKVRTQKKAWPRVIELTAQALAGCPVERMAILHVAAREDALQFEQMVRAALPCPERIMVAGFSAGLSVHAGAGLVGVCAVAAA